MANKILSKTQTNAQSNSDKLLNVFTNPRLNVFTAKLGKKATVRSPVFKEVKTMPP